MVLKVIHNEFREFWQMLKTWVFFQWHGFKLNVAIHIANAKQKALNKQIRVILNSKRKFEWWTNEDFKRHKRKRTELKNWGSLELSQT